MIALQAREPVPPLTPAQWALADDFRDTFSTDQGKRVLAYLEGASGFTQPLISSAEDLPMSPVREGRRQLYLEIREQLVIAATTEREIAKTTPGVDAFGRQETP